MKIWKSRFVLLAVSAFIATSIIGQEPVAPGSNFVQAAKPLFRSGKMEEALRLLDQADAGRKPSAESLDLRGGIFLEQGKFDEATRAFQAAYETEPSLFLPRLHLGDTLFRQKKYAEARDAYESLLRETNVLMSNERVRFGILLTYLAEKNKERAQNALARIKFPTETPAYYYSQAAWAFAEGDERAAKKWIATGQQISSSELAFWFTRKLHDLGWIKAKPAPVEV